MLTWHPFHSFIHSFVRSLTHLRRGECGGERGAGARLWWAGSAPPCRAARTHRRQVRHRQQRDDALAGRGALLDVVTRERAQAEQLILVGDRGARREGIEVQLPEVDVHEARHSAERNVGLAVSEELAVHCGGDGEAACERGWHGEGGAAGFGRT